jgi:hypothetical protein
VEETVPAAWNQALVRQLFVELPVPSSYVLTRNSASRQTRPAAPAIGPKLTPIEPPRVPQTTAQNRLFEVSKDRLTAHCSGRRIVVYARYLPLNGRHIARVVFPRGHASASVELRTRFSVASPVRFSVLASDTGGHGRGRLVFVGPPIHRIFSQIAQAKLIFAHNLPSRGSLGLTHHPAK